MQYDPQVVTGQAERWTANLTSAIVSLVIVIAESFQMLDLEVAYIWQAEWSTVKGLYILNRVLPFIFLPSPVILFTYPTPRPVECKAIFALVVFGFALCVLSAEVLLYLRIYALSGRTRGMRNFLIFNGVAIYLITFVSLSLFIKTGSWGLLTTSPRPYGCSILQAKNIYIVIAYSTVLYSGLATLVLSVWLGIANYRSIRDSKLLQIFYRDGLFYFIVMACMTIVNGVTAARLPVGYQFIMGPPQAAVHSILVTRMVIHLKEHGEFDTGYSTERTKSGMEFESIPLTMITGTSFSSNTAVSSSRDHTTLGSI